jgi:hypothetical protein
MLCIYLLLKEKRKDGFGETTPTECKEMGDILREI